MGRYIGTEGQHISQKEKYAGRPSSSRRLRWWDSKALFLLWECSA